MVDPLWRVVLLGGLRACGSGRELTRFRTRKTGALLAYLAFNLGRDVPRETLQDLLWPECEVEDGRHSLNTALSALRHEMAFPAAPPDAPVLVSSRASVRLCQSAVVTDVREFERAVRAAHAAASPEETARHLTTAVDLYGGDLLPGFTEEWVFDEQQRLQDVFFAAVAQLVRLLEAGDRHGAALQYALRAVCEDPLREEAQQDVIRLQVRLGQWEAARRQYAELERRLRRDLDVEPQDATASLLRGPATSAKRGQQARAQDASLEPPGGAVPLGSRFYVVRPADNAFGAAMQRGDSVVLIKGARQVGKTSLLARGLQAARATSAAVALTNLQELNATDLASPGALLLALAESLYEQLDLDERPSAVWDLHRGASTNMRRYVRSVVLRRSDRRVVWGLDEVDRVFHCPYSSDIFGLFRSWHDARALDPEGPWTNLTVAIAYSTEAHLFIADLNQSPFNVGTPIALEDFTVEQVAELNARHGAPLKDRHELARFSELVGGHPYLVRRGLYEMATHDITLHDFEAKASAEHWLLGDHLRRVESLARRDGGLAQALRAVLAGRPCPTRDAFLRLRSAGVLSGSTAGDARVRCRLYTQYLLPRFA